MIYSEASYFDGYHFQHVVAYHEHLRLASIHKRARARLRNQKRKTS